MEKTFQTGSFSFRLRFPEELVLPADMEKFAVEKESTDYTYTITIVDILPEAEGELLVNRVDLQVFRNGEGLESRLIGVKGEERPYALYRETAQKHAQVFVGRWYLDGVAKYEVVFLSLLALERRLSELGRVSVALGYSRASAPLARAASGQRVEYASATGTYSHQINRRAAAFVSAGYSDSFQTGVSRRANIQVGAGIRVTLGTIR